MKKEPAFMFYFRDFLVSTDLMTNEQVGAHIRILCHQADKGHLSESSIRERICGPIWESLMGRYKQDHMGNWFHPRLERVLDERANFVKNRLDNLKPPHKDTPHENPIREPHMGGSPSPSPSPSESSVPISKSNKSRRALFAPPTVEEVAAYCLERGNQIQAERFVDHYISNGWKVGKNPMRDWKATVRTWEKNEISGKVSQGSKFGPQPLTPELFKEQVESIERLSAIKKEQQNGK